MAKKTTTYRITASPGFMIVLVWELRQWGESRYEVDKDAIVTTCKNVVDVATETFIDAPHLITITKTKGGEGNANQKRSLPDHEVPEGAAA